MTLTSRLAWATLATTLVLLVVGGAVHATGSSLACPDWPLCHGEAMPRMVGGVAWEHSHRLLGGAVFLLASVLCVVALRGGDRTLRILAPIVLGLVVVQALLGAATVLMRISMPVSSLHLALGLGILGLSSAIAMRASTRERLRVAPGLRARVLFSLVVTYLQAVLGGLVRHTGAGVACGDDPLLCLGVAWPEWSDGRLHLAHRALALVVLVAIGGLAIELRRHRSTTLRGISLGAFVLVLVQVGLGVLSVTSHLAPWATTAHLGVAALLVSLLAVAATLTHAEPSEAIHAGARPELKA
ncbi:MAG: COX15/CtaA family protein [Sandaracinaceae bacterium]|nr:COX15/CtaA family protein [Sandaracinaceae bacterium]